MHLYDDIGDASSSLRGSTSSSVGLSVGLYLHISVSLSMGLYLHISVSMSIGLYLHISVSLCLGSLPL